jgi:hypothetical protein
LSTGYQLMLVRNQSCQLKTDLHDNDGGDHIPLKDAHLTPSFKLYFQFRFYNEYDSMD